MTPIKLLDVTCIHVIYFLVIILHYEIVYINENIYIDYQLIIMEVFKFTHSDLCMD